METLPFGLSSKIIRLRFGDVIAVNDIGGDQKAVEHKLGPTNSCEEDMKRKEELKLGQNMISSMPQHFYVDDYESEEDYFEMNHKGVSRRGGSSMRPLKKPRYGKGGRGWKQQTTDEVRRKELRDKACRDIARWFYDAGIPFNAATYPSFDVMVKAIGQFGLGMKPPTMHELEGPFLDKEVQDMENLVMEHRKEWAVTGCSILSYGWCDSVVQKNIANFLVNSPKGSA